MYLKKLIVLGSVAVMAAVVTSCSNNGELFDSEAAVNQQKAEYEANFVKKYGKIDPNQSWDFATMQPSYSLVPSADAPAQTRTNNSFSVTKGSITIEKKVIKWMFDNMKAGDNNTKKGSPFYMVVPENSFTIAPIFQGTASYYWELWMHVDGVGEIKIWEKAQDLTYRLNASTNQWTNPGVGNAGVSRNAYEVNSPTYEFKDLPVGSNMYFYLKVWNNKTLADADHTGCNVRILTSLQHQMLALQGLDRPKNVPEDNEVTIIGCEDDANGDFDYEDLVFMMYGNPAPPINHVDEVLVTTGKRYMMEDLGATDDFDFNDVVVDVTKSVKKRITYKFDENGAKVFDKEQVIEEYPQQAIVRAAGGTIDFTLTIGQTQWTKSEHVSDVKVMVNTGADGKEIDYNAIIDQFEVKGWDPETNNISVVVKGRGANDGVKTITFPKKGQAPMIIAIDPKPVTNWMKERVSVPTNWFTTEEETEE
jgi:hypothetical protein